MKTNSFLKILILGIIFLVINFTNYLNAQDFYVVDANSYNLSANCSRNVNCQEGKDYNSASRNCTVGLATLSEGTTFAVQILGTGVLLSYDTDGSTDELFEFYILTAAHIFDEPNGIDINKLFLVFNYQHQFCNRSNVSPLPNFYQVLPPRETQPKIYEIGTGGYPLNSNDDWALIKVNGRLQDKVAGLCLCGWDANPTNYVSNMSTSFPDDAACVSHPRGDVKKITTLKYQNNSDPNNMKAFGSGLNVASGTWEMNLKSGVIQIGSSGSGLVTTNKVTGCFNCVSGIASAIDAVSNDCDTRTIYYTKFEVAYPFIKDALIGDPNEGVLQGSVDHFDGINCVGFTVGGTCFDNTKNQTEDEIDCCYPNTGCNICPPCFPVSGGGEGEYSCIAYLSDFDLLEDCFNPNSRIPKVKFRIRADCGNFLRFEWRESGQNTPTGDINPNYQRTHIGGLISELTFSWDFHGGTPTFPMSKTYTLYAIDDRTIHTIATAQFPVTIYGPAIVNAGQDLSMCVNQTEQLNGQFQGGNYYANPVWQAIPSNGLNYLSNANVLNPLLTPTQVGTYRYILEVRDAMNCSGFDTLTVTVDTVTRPAVLRLTCVVPPNRYQAGRIYTAETCSTTVSSPTSTDFVGAQEVNLLPGFTASAGATFTARIAPCAVEDEPIAPPQGKLSEPQPVSESKPLAENEFEVDVFPNPNDGTFTVRYKSLTDKFISVRIYDNIGRKLIEKKWNDRLYDFEVDLSSYASGVYHVVVSDGEHTLTKKVLKK